MFESDYILRMFSMLGRALARIIFFRETKNYDAALLEVDNTGRSLLGLNTDTIERLPVSDLKNVLGSDPSLAQSRLYTAGVLLKEKGEILELKDEDSDSAGLYLKALRLMTDEIKGIEEVDGRKGIANVDAVIGKLKDYELPSDMKRKLIDYYEYSGRFDKAEDVIFEMVDESASFAGEGISYYERLLKRSDFELEAGHLPRAEAEDALRELNEIRQRADKD